MIDRELTASKKLAKLNERAALLYVIGVSHADVQGRLEADDLSLMEFAGRYGLARGWTPETIAEDRAAIAASGLWIVWGDGEDTFAQVIKFHAHNRTDVADESPSAIPEPQGYSDAAERKKYGRPPYHKRRRKLQPKGDSKSTLPQPYVEQEPEQEQEPEPEHELLAAAAASRTPLRGRGNATTTGQKPTTTVTHIRPDHEARAQRLMDAWRAAWNGANADHPDRPPMFCPPIEFYDAQATARALGETVDAFDDQQLTAEFRRVLRCADAKGWKALTFKGIAKHLGQLFEGTEEPYPVTWSKEA
jgi:hypothetical protein